MLMSRGQSRAKKEAESARRAVQAIERIRAKRARKDKQSALTLQPAAVVKGVQLASSPEPRR